MKLFGKNNPKPTDKQLIGAKGEDLAVYYLKKHGFTVVDRNYTKKWSEIDVVATKKGNLHFLEIKTVTEADVNRETLDQYEPSDNVHPHKLKRLYRVIESYLLEKEVSDDTDWQLDLLFVYLNTEGKLIQMEYLEDVF